MKGQVATVMRVCVEMVLVQLVAAVAAIGRIVGAFRVAICHGECR